MDATHSCVGDVFTRDATDYDAIRKQLIPCFDALYATVIRLMGRFSTMNQFNVIDLGSGTGLLASMISQIYPNADLRLIDISEGMLNEARKRFSGRENISFELGDMSSVELGTHNNVIVSALAIHHLSDSEKIRLYTKIYKSLAPGGMFINAEQVAGPSDALDQSYERIWLEDIVRLGVPDAGPSHMTSRP